MRDNELLKKAINNDEGAKDAFIAANMGLVYSMVYRFKQTRIARDDLIQVGSLGLIKALNNFDLSYNVAFSTYAVPIILGEIKRYFRDEGSMHVSRSLKELYLKILKEKEILSKDLGYDPSYKELAAHLNVDEGEVMEAYVANQFVSSLDELIQNDSDLSLEDTIGYVDDENMIIKMSMKKEVSRLNERDQLFLHYRYIKELNQCEIAKLFNVSQVQISRMEKRIIADLKQKLLDT